MRAYAHGYITTMKTAGVRHMAQWVSEEALNTVKSPYSLVKNLKDQSNLRGLREELSGHNIPETMPFNAKEQPPVVSDIVDQATSRGILQPPPDDGQKIAPSALMEEVLGESARDMRNNIRRATTLGMGGEIARRQFQDPEEVIVRVPASEVEDYLPNKT